MSGKAVRDTLGFLAVVAGLVFVVSGQLAPPASRPGC